ncbi:outer membrane beta-barrel protein [Bacteroides helcogenes]|uniref:Outer membrane protein beta-barrel domain-containing protein n=1 Tax=Bacteroides helcogenes (strain ATCC 35417 / DSM 20613 / JCM 6297 / CCUG 15421 / P 36-108) TaxID=693979 RepID=E6SSV0_BACT6|nr:outer membrane beta-barrel protein [Bacteroides helcogenes]ADV44181.1 hypothetical protein Bache_2212 [Bacteroides helcogenes P 36-108]MDY5238406.1 outer membrane beta-barrel protein [Bacteroides helcogenes]
MKIIIISICFAMGVLTSVAQCPVSFHAEGGIGTSYFWGKNSSSETKIAYKAGISAGFALSKTWEMQSALEFVSIGGKDEIEYVGKANMNELYLQIPVMIAAHLKLSKNYHISLSAGPYIAIGIGGKTSGEKYDYTSSSLSGNYRFRLNTFGKMQENNIGNNRFDTGITMKLIFEYHRFIIGAETQVGLITVNKQLNQIINSNENSRYLPKNFASFFTFGYRFR